MDYSNSDNSVPALRMADYTYELPESRIAFDPVHPRHNSRLLYYNQGLISHHVFKELPEVIGNNSCLILNDTKVIPARLLYYSGGVRIEILLLSAINQNAKIWETMVGNRRRFHADMELESPPYQKEGRIGSLVARWYNRESNIVEFSATGELSVAELIELHGKMPLPPYIKRDATEDDRSDYQTVFAKNEGAVAAPTASLHFSEEVFDDLRNKGVEKTFLTLHVGMGTFKPVTAEVASEHEMHTERFIITTELLRNLKKHSGNIVPVGTTAMRVVESLFYIGAQKLLKRQNPAQIQTNAGFDQELNDVKFEDALKSLEDLLSQNGGILNGETAIFIVPGFKFRFSNALITNFHQPGSTLLLLVAAFVGSDWKEIYESALGTGYRFLSYGDSSLLVPASVEKRQ